MTWVPCWEWWVWLATLLELARGNRRQTNDLTPSAQVLTYVEHYSETEFWVVCYHCWVLVQWSKPFEMLRSSNETVNIGKEKCPLAPYDTEAQGTWMHFQKESPEFEVQVYSGRYAVSVENFSSHLSRSDSLPEWISLFFCINPSGCNYRAHSSPVPCLGRIPLFSDWEAVVFVQVGGMWPSTHRVPASPRSVWTGAVIPLLEAARLLSVEEEKPGKCDWAWQPSVFAKMLNEGPVALRPYSMGNAESTSRSPFPSCLGWLIARASRPATEGLKSNRWRYICATWELPCLGRLQWPWEAADQHQLGQLDCKAGGSQRNGKALGRFSDLLCKLGLDD